MECTIVRVETAIGVCVAGIVEWRHRRVLAEILIRWRLHLHEGLMEGSVVGIVIKHLWCDGRVMVVGHD